MADNGLRLAELVDLVADDVTDDEFAVYAHREVTRTCGITEDPFHARLVDVAHFFNVETEEWEHRTVYAFVARCQKEWEEAEYEIIAHQCEGVPGPPVGLPREILLRGGNMEDCTPDENPCPFTSLVYDEGDHRWRGSLALAKGSLEVEFYCEFDGLDYLWFARYTGCVYPYVQLLALVCPYPPRWVGGGDIPFADCCNLIFPLPTITLSFMAMVDPLYEARLVDWVPSGGGPGGGYCVYATDEQCEDECLTSTGCCPGQNIDDQLEYTIFGVGCGCGGQTGPGTLPDGCLTFGLEGCSTSITICLVCQGYEEGRTWRNYRLRVGTTLYAPVSGGCDPLSLTFVNISATLNVGPYGTCLGTFSVTVTRPT